MTKKSTIERCLDENEEVLKEFKKLIEGGTSKIAGSHLVFLVRSCQKKTDMEIRRLQKRGTSGLKILERVSPQIMRISVLEAQIARMLNKLTWLLDAGTEGEH